MLPSVFDLTAGGNCDVRRGAIGICGLGLLAKKLCG